MTLPPPATEAGIYLKAIHEVLCEIRAALVDGPQGASSPVGKPDNPQDSGSVELTEPAPTKRTRTRARG